MVDVIIQSKQRYATESLGVLSQVAEQIIWLLDCTHTPKPFDVVLNE